MKKPHAEPTQEDVDALEQEIFARDGQGREDIAERRREEDKQYEARTADLRAAWKTASAELKRREDAERVVETKLLPNEILIADVMTALNVSADYVQRLVRDGKLACRVNSSGVMLFERLAVEALRLAREQAKQNEFTANRQFAKPQAEEVCAATR